MAYVAKEFEISFFDLHFSFAPLEDEDLVQSHLRYLVQPAAYHFRHESGGRMDFEGFRAWPLRHELAWHHFWQQFSGVWIPGLSDHQRWFQHLPVSCRPVDFAVQAVVPQFGIDCPAKCSVLLWPYGWSSTLRLYLSADLPLTDLRALVLALQRGRPGAFRLDGDEIGLSRVFQRIGDRICASLYGSSKPPGLTRVISRHKVIAILSQQGEPLAYEALDDIDRRHLHGALLGKDLSLREHTTVREREGFLTTRLDGTDFAFTRFEEGTLLSLTGGRARTRRRRKAVRCLVNNLRTCSQAVFALAHFVQRARRVEDRADKIGKLATTARAILAELPDKYRNPFCERFMQANTTVVGAREMPPREGAEGGSDR